MLKNSKPEHCLCPFFYQESRISCFVLRFWGSEFSGKESWSNSFDWLKLGIFNRVLGSYDFWFKPWYHANDIQPSKWVLSQTFECSSKELIFNQILLKKNFSSNQKPYESKTLIFNSVFFKTGLTSRFIILDILLGDTILY
jgi:hypothetical protein